MMNLFILVGSLFLFWSADANGHSGGLDSNGCHGGSQPYHCHRSSSEMVGNRLRCDLGSRSKDCIDSAARTGASAQNANAKAKPISVALNSSVGDGDWSKWKKDFDQKIRLKNVQCENGRWKVDLLNNHSKSQSVGWTFWTEDEDGDSLGSTNGMVSMTAKARRTIDMGVSCSVDFGEIKMDIR